ncbi:hypothetical protein BDF14DRAFT_1764586 [Spinellus fusiger]|nr:hypothetical protein BDF14DRAFT_1764586 [Spinellus fusiger]
MSCFDSDLSSDPSSDPSVTHTKGRGSLPGTSTHPQRPTFTTRHSSDVYQWKTLQRTLPSSKDPRTRCQMTVEPAYFPEQTMFSNDCIRTYTQGDGRSIRSSSDTNKHNKKSIHATPTALFARTLSNAIHDLRESDEHETFVYRDRGPSPWYAPSLSLGDTAKEKRPPIPQHVRPVLRSTVSELVHTPPRPHLGWWYPSDSDNDSVPLLSPSYPRKPPRRHRRLYRAHSKTKYRLVGCLLGFLGLLGLVFLICVSACLLAVPLSEVHAVTIHHVLGTQKELIFDLCVRATNHNEWSVHISHTAFSVFASSHYVPVSKANATRDTQQEMFPGSPMIFLATVERLQEPFIFMPGATTTSSSQIQISSPGEFHGDRRDNDRWSLLLRYPYQLTVRGVLQYRTLPFIFMPIYSARVCKEANVNPATGLVTLLSLSSVCL